MKKITLLLFLICLSSCENSIKTYYHVGIVKDSFGGRKPVIEEKIQDFLEKSDSAAMKRSYSIFLISTIGEEFRDAESAEFLKTETIDYKLLDENKKVIVSTLSDEVKKELEIGIRKTLTEAKNYKAQPANPEDQFSKWDGSHIKLTEYLKGQMNDPDSYEHVETKAGTRTDHILVVTKIRGKNAYGGTVTTVYEAKCDKETGRVLSVVKL